MTVVLDIWKWGISWTAWAFPHLIQSTIMICYEILLHFAALDVLWKTL